METSTASFTNQYPSKALPMFQSWCDAKQIQVSTFMKSSNAVNAMINLTLSLVTITGNILILLSLRRSSARRIKGPLLQSRYVRSRCWFGSPASVLYRARGRAIDTRDMRDSRSHYQCRWGYICGDILADIVSYQCGSCPCYSAQDALQRSCFCFPRASRINHLLVLQYFPCVFDLLQPGILQPVSDPWHHFVHRCLHCLVHHYFPHSAKTAKSSSELQSRGRSIAKFLQHKTVQEIRVHCTVGVCVPSSVLHAIYVVPYRQDRLGNESNISCNTVVYCFYDLHELRVESYLVLLENPRSEGFNEGNY